MQQVPHVDEDDEGDSDSDLDVRISRSSPISCLFTFHISHHSDLPIHGFPERIQRTRRTDDNYPSDDEHPDSLARRKRRFAKSYITPSAAHRAPPVAPSTSSRRARDMDDDSGCGPGPGEPHERRPKRTFFHSKLDFGKLNGVNGQAAEEWRQGVWGVRA